MEKIKELIKKVCTRDVILYVVFGVLTTIVNIGSFFIMNSFLHIEENIANIIAISLAVLVAYFTNKDLVFHSQASNFTEKLKEFGKFILGRLATMLLEWGCCKLLFDYTPIPNMISKCTVTVLVIILNFFISKFFAFKKNT